MRGSLLGALASLAVLLGLMAAGLPPLLLGLAGAVTASFGALVLAHAVAYVYHATHPTPMALSRPCCGQRRRIQPALLPLQRRPLLPTLLSLPAAFGLTQLAWVPRAAAQPAGTNALAPMMSASKEFMSSIPCACGGACVFRATFDYDYVPLAGDKKQVTRFKMTWYEPEAGSCQPEIERGFGAFDFQCGNEKPCKITGGNIFRCPCETVVQFVPLGDSDMDDCRCPNPKNKVAYAQGVCGAPISVEKECSTFQWINLDFTHKLTCGCGQAENRGGLVVFVQYKDGTITFDKAHPIL
jgi:hypothetical protein